QSATCLSERRVLRAQRVPGLGLGQHPSDHVEDRAPGIMGATLRKIGRDERRLGEQLNLVADLRDGYSIILQLGLLMHHGHNGRGEFPVTRRAVVTVQASESREALLFQEVEVLDQRTKLKQLVSTEVIRKQT